MTDSLPADLAAAIAFHGHYCPGLTIGYRAAKIALRELGVERARDEELVAICETDACGVDAIQHLTGCTVGKGNLLLRDWGKQVFTFGRRADGKLLRLAMRPDVFADLEAGEHTECHRAKIDRLHSLPDEDLFDVRWVESPLPEQARIFRSVRCAKCGEGVMEARAHLQDGQPVCPECYGSAYTRGW